MVTCNGLKWEPLDSKSFGFETLVEGYENNVDVNGWMRAKNDRRFLDFSLEGIMVVVNIGG